MDMIFENSITCSFCGTKRGHIKFKSVKPEIVFCEPCLLKNIGIKGIKPNESYFRGLERKEQSFWGRLFS